MTSQIIYMGDLHTESTHLQSKTVVSTDAPVDNNGRGEAFSPTDLVANSLGTCMMTIMGMKAVSMGIDLKGTKIDVTKKMLTDIRRIGEIVLVFHFPELNLSEKDKTILERVAHSCPVGLSLSSELKQNITFKW